MQHKNDFLQEPQEQLEENKDVSLQSENSDASHNTAQQLEQQVQECQQMLTHWKDQYIRITADFENFKKRLEKERTHMSRIIKSDILFDLLPIVDNIERALSAEQKTNNIEAVLQGFDMIYKELCKMLQKQGVTPMHIDRDFDPELHEAVMSVTSEQHSSGEIVQVLQKGYLINGHVLRPAKVSIAT